MKYRCVKCNENLTLIGDKLKCHKCENKRVNLIADYRGCLSYLLSILNQEETSLEELKHYKNHDAIEKMGFEEDAIEKVNKDIGHLKIAINLIESEIAKL